jgi:hypothetical protein
MGRHYVITASALLGALALAEGKISAQNIDSLRASYAIVAPSGVESPPMFTMAPGSSSGSPTAYGAEWGDVFFGGDFQSRARYTKDLPLNRRVDGAVYLGIGLGNPRNNLGIELVGTSFTTIREGFFRKNSFSFKVHRDLPLNLAIAYGWEDAIGAEGLDGGSSMYGVMTSRIPLRGSETSFLSSLTLSAGAGNGRFQNETDFYNGENHLNAFGSVGLRVFRPISLIADWTGQDLMLGTSIIPTTRLPLFVTASYADVTGKAGDGARFVMGAGLDFSLLGR